MSQSAACSPKAAFDCFQKSSFLLRVRKGPGTQELYEFLLSAFGSCSLLVCKAALEIKEEGRWECALGWGWSRVQGLGRKRTLEKDDGGKRVVVG